MKVSLDNFHIERLGCLSYSVTEKGQSDEFGISDIAKFYEAGQSLVADTEFLLLQKCNCTEIYFYSSNEDAEEKLTDLWRSSVLDKANFDENNIVRYYGVDSVRHILETSIGLKSVSFGDSQVLAQVRNSPKEASKHYLNIPILTSIIRVITKEADRIRKLSGINTGYTSVSRLVADIIVTKAHRKDNILIIGAGETGSLLVKLLDEKGFVNVDVSNRTESKAAGLVERGYCRSIVEFDHVKKGRIYGNYDVIVFAITYSGKLLVKTNEQTQIIFDLCNPRVVENDGGIELIDIAHISEISRKNMIERRSKLRIIKSEIKKNLDKIIKSIKLEYNKYQATVNYNYQLDRDYAVVSNNARIRSIALFSIRKNLISKDYIEVNTPSVTAVPSDPVRGKNRELFPINWYGKKMYLRQSNQLYKQILIQKGFDKIFEIGPFWREEYKLTPRHTAEATGLDIELFNPQSAYELIHNAEDLLVHLGDDLIKSQFIDRNPFKGSLKIFEYEQILQLLSTWGLSYNQGTDLGYDLELQISKAVKRDYGTDFFAIVHYPDTIKKFYTKVISGGLTETFDIFFKGWEISSGAVRQLNINCMKEQMQEMGINYKKYEFYMGIIDKYQRPHGGYCLGLDRILTKMFDKEHINEFIIFPRSNIFTLP